MHQMEGPLHAALRLFSAQQHASTTSAAAQRPLMRSGAVKLQARAGSAMFTPNPDV